jgi:hypothetical protein
MEYNIVEARDSYNLTIEVNKLIRQGWKPLGCAQMCKMTESVYNQDHLTFIQTMIKE